MRVALAPPHRLDIRFRDLLRALALCVVARTVPPSSGHFLSVRSGFSALLQVVGWPRGSEVLMSAVTIDDMPRLVRLHGFRPVAVDIDPVTFAVSVDELRSKITSRTRAIVIAQLFGSRNDLAEVAALAKEYNLLLIEDCAQAFTGHVDVGAADVAMWSFGTIKTNTALGGAVFVFRDRDLASATDVVAQAWPMQSQWSFAAKALKIALLVLMQRPLFYGVAAAVLWRGFGMRVGDAARRFTRGFGSVGDMDWIAALHRQPCGAQCRFLVSRLRSFDGNRVGRRAKLGNLWLRALPGAFGSAASAPSHWIVGIAVDYPDEFRDELYGRARIDASAASNLVAIGGLRAVAMLDSLVLLPVYPELGEEFEVAMACVLIANGHFHVKEEL